MSRCGRHNCSSSSARRPFSNQYYKHFEKGIYSCVVCAEPLFLSQSKYDSKSGWPAFYDIIDETKVTYKQDLSHCKSHSHSGTSEELRDFVLRTDPLPAPRSHVLLLVNPSSPSLRDLSNHEL